jgi:hypothetical protein
MEKNSVRIDIINTLIGAQLEVVPTDNNLSHSASSGLIENFGKKWTFGR